MPWSFKAELMGIPDSSNGETFHKWAQLPISREQYRLEQMEEHRRLFPECQLLPGISSLLHDLRDAKNANGDKIHIALASSTSSYHYELKTSRPEVKSVISVFTPDKIVLGDDPRVKSGNGKPAPDIFLLALSLVNSSLAPEEEPIRPDECLVFEDSIPGVEAGRRAGMRVLWVPHSEVEKVFRGREEEVLAGRTVLVPIGNEKQLGEIGDGWATQLETLEGFPAERWGIVLGS